jgi:hypothetical protein
LRKAGSPPVTNQETGEKRGGQTMFVHTVLFWLKDGSGEDVRQAMVRDALGSLGRIAAVRHIWAGAAVESPREIVDSSFDVGLCVVFDGRDGHDAYQTDPLHQEFVRRFSQYWERVRVYDFQ